MIYDTSEISSSTNNFLSHRLSSSSTSTSTSTYSRASPSSPAPTKPVGDILTGESQASFRLQIQIGSSAAFDLPESIDETTERRRMIKKTLADLITRIQNKSKSKKKNGTSAPHNDDHDADDASSSHPELIFSPDSPTLVPSVSAASTTALPRSSGRDVTPPPADETPGQLMTGFGFHDVVIETPLHSLHLSHLPPSQIALVLGAYTTRILHFLDGGSSMHGKYPLQKKRPETRPGTSTDGIEHQEPLEPGAVIGELPDPIQAEIDDLFADGVVATGEVVGGVLLAGDELLGVEELAVGTGADLLIAEEEGVLRSSSMKG
ncbi:hypothetical protein ACLB2K_069908 [Fragaria x ananassa]